MNKARARLVSNHLCGVTEIAKVFHVSERKAREWIREGMPCVLIGNKWQCKYEDCWEWLKTRNFKKAVK